MITDTQTLSRYSVAPSDKDFVIQFQYQNMYCSSHSLSDKESHIVTKLWYFGFSINT